MNKAPPFSFIKTHGYVNLICVFFIKNYKRFISMHLSFFFSSSESFGIWVSTGLYNSDPVYMIIEPGNEWKIGPES
jgi:hypothetical protein